ncbi:MAG: thioesterase family protein [Chloroflexota bacterium]
MDSITPPTSEGYRHHLAVQVRWGDMDAFGHVNNANYLTYLEMARIDYAYSMWKRTRERGLIIARIAIDFKLPLFAGDDVHLFTRTVRLGNRSFDTEQLITRWKDGELQVAAQATVTIVVFDYSSNQSAPIPDEWRKVVSEYEGISL